MESSDPALPRSPHPALRLVLLLPFVLSLSGCISHRYRMVKADREPPDPLNVMFAPAPLQARLATLITYQGHGSWKLEALWDEYVVTLHNPGTEPLVIGSAVLVDSAGVSRSAGMDPWALEKESKILEKQYKHAGVEFVRRTAPAAVIVGTGAVVAATAGGSGFLIPAGAVVAIEATLVALPIYYLIAWNENSISRGEVLTEFNRRRWALPSTLQPGESLTCSLYFPMVASPRLLTLRWQRGDEHGDAALTLDFLHRLHLQSPAPDPKR